MKTATKPREIAGNKLWSDPEFLDEGNDGIIYRIAHNLVAKSSLTASHEFKIMRALYEKGVSVPNPYGLHVVPRVYDRYNHQTTPPALVMEYISGRTGFELRLNPSAQKEAEELRDVELEIAREFGFIPGDVHFGNFILTSNEKIVLIDFADWSHPTIPNLFFN